MRKPKDIPAPKPQPKRVTVLNLTSVDLTDMQKSLGFIDIPKNYVAAYEKEYMRDVLSPKPLKDILETIVQPLTEVRRNLIVSQLDVIAGLVESSHVVVDLPEDMWEQLRLQLEKHKIGLFSTMEEAERFLKGDPCTGVTYKPLPKLSDSIHKKGFVDTESKIDMFTTDIHIDDLTAEDFY